jgi:cystathionine beta-lyase
VGAGGLSGFDFDTQVDRAGTLSEKYELRRQLFGTDAIEPLSVADMDLAAPPAVQRALAARVAHPVYGYTVVPDSVPMALAAWLARRHAWPVAPDDISLAPGVVPTLYAAVAAFSEPGDGVIVQPPVYPPFFDSVTRQGRALLENPLRETPDGFAMDLDHLDTLARGGARLLLLCSPHNPVGRVWREDELQTLLDIARRHCVTIVSDEIHADLVYAPCHGAAVDAPVHKPLGRLADADDAVVTVVSPSKTFNIPGLGLSAGVVRHAEVARRLRTAFDRMPVSVANPLSLVAFEAAYNESDAWLDACLTALRANRDALFGAFGAGFSRSPDATYLAWLDCRAMGLDDAALIRRWVAAGLGPSAGVRFGTGGCGFVRLNFAIPSRRMATVLERIATVAA